MGPGMAGHVRQSQAAGRSWRPITGAGRGELCALQVCDIDLDNAILHIAYNHVVVGGRKVRKDTKTHQDRYLAIDPVTCAMIRGHLDAIRSELAGVGLGLPEDA